LVMSSAMSELGPLDVQLLQRDEIGQRRSGMVVRTALGGLSAETFDVFEAIMLGIKVKSGHTISLEMASRIAAQIATGVMTPVYAQINPEALGNDLRDLNVAKAYGDRLVEHGKNAEDTTVRRLVEGYPEHGFIIDKAEASELFKRVSEPSIALIKLARALGSNVYTEQSPHYIMRVDQKEDIKHEERDGTADSQENAPSLDVRRETDWRSDPQGKQARKGSKKTSERRKVIRFLVENGAAATTSRVQRLKSFNSVFRSRNRVARTIVERNFRRAGQKHCFCLTSDLLLGNL